LTTFFLSSDCQSYAVDQGNYSYVLSPQTKMMLSACKECYWLKSSNQKKQIDQSRRRKLTTIKNRPKNSARKYYLL